MIRTNKGYYKDFYSVYMDMKAHGYKSVYIYDFELIGGLCGGELNDVFTLSDIKDFVYYEDSFVN